MPRPSKLTENTVKTIENALEQGYSVRVACQVANLSTSSFHAWKARGRREAERLERSRSTRPRTAEAPFLDCFWRFRRAAVMPELLMLATMNRLAAGGYPLEQTRTVEHLALPDGGIFDAETVTTTYAQPDGRAACWLLERRWPEKWGRRKNPPQVLETVGMTVSEWQSIRNGLEPQEGNTQL